MSSDPLARIRPGVVVPSDKQVSSASPRNRSQAALCEAALGERFDVCE